VSSGPRDADALSEAVWHLPGGQVGDAVAAYHGYRQQGVAPAVHRGLPSPYLTMIFTIDEPLHIAQHADPRTPGGFYDAIVGGLHTTPALITHDGAQSGIQLRVNPLAARALFGLPAGALVGHDGEATAVLGSIATDTHDRLRAAATWEQRFAVLDRALSRMVAARQDAIAPPAAAVVQAWRLLLRSGGRMPVGMLAKAVGYSDRHLANMFRTELGLTPKAAGRVIRFDRARRALQRQTTNTIGDVAARHGYYDQSHLVRDFVDFAGLPPTAWLAEEFGNIQADGAGNTTGLAS
jgi:AraC-like DNA-binding protein